MPRVQNVLIRWILKLWLHYDCKKYITKAPHIFYSIIKILDANLLTSNIEIKYIVAGGVFYDSLSCSSRTQPLVMFTIKYREIKIQI